MNTIKITALSFLFLFVASAVQGDVVNIPFTITTAGHSSAGPYFYGSSEGWTAEKFDSRGPSSKQTDYLGDGGTNNRDKLRNLKLVKTVNGLWWKYSNADIITHTGEDLSEGYIKIFANFKLPGSSDVRWDFSDIAITLTSSNKSDTATTILFAEIQKVNSATNLFERVAGIEKNDTGDWIADTFLLPSEDDYIFAVYAYFDYGKASFQKNFSANVILEPVSSTPEPTTLLLFGLGIAATFAATRKRRRQ